MWSNRKKSVDVCEVVHDGRGRQRCNETSPVPFRSQPRVEHREDAAIAAMADEAAQALLQRENGERHLMLAERIAEWLAQEPLS